MSNSQPGKKLPAFSYFGSKHRLSMQIIKFLPPHNAWVDAFCGSAAITLAKSPAPIEIINDINNDIVNFFEQLRENEYKIIRLANLTPYARQELSNARKHAKKGANSERARKFLVASMMAINGVFGSDMGGFSYSNSYSRNGIEARVNRWNNMPQRLSYVANRLRQVRIENTDARTLLKAFINRPATLVYLDPPYFTKRTNGYDFDQQEEKFHCELLQLACKAKCMVIISGYDNPLYNTLLTEANGWKAIRIATYTQGNNGKRVERIEFLWQNSSCVKAYETGRVPIRLTVREKRLGKINPIR